MTGSRPLPEQVLQNVETIAPSFTSILFFIYG